MQKGIPELSTLVAAIFIPQILVDALPSKYCASIFLIPAILSLYIALKIIERNDNLQLNKNEAGNDNNTE
jgi:hypothetical protein